MSDYNLRNVKFTLNMRIMVQLFSFISDILRTYHSGFGHGLLAGYITVLY